MKQIIKELLIRAAFIVFLLFGVRFVCGSWWCYFTFYGLIIYILWATYEYLREAWQKRKKKK